MESKYPAHQDHRWRLNQASKCLLNLHEGWQSHTLIKIYAHRGASYDFPETSLAAYQAAITQGADGFECDLRLTKDGVVVACHDADLQRVASSPLVVADSTYNELLTAYPILTLSEILELAIANRKDLALETKHPVPTRGAIEIAVGQILMQEQERIRAAQIQVVLMSFSWRAVARAKMLGLATVFLANHSLPLRAARGSSLGPSISTLRATRRRMKKLATRADQKIFVWTVDEARDVELCREIGVDVIITNRPGYVRELLSHIGA